jgi:hypothetical protein
VRVDEDDEIMLITDGGTLVRTRVADVSQMGRDTQGVTMIRLSKDERLIGIERIEALDGEDDDGDSDRPPSNETQRSQRRKDRKGLKARLLLALRSAAAILFKSVTGSDATAQLKRYPDHTKRVLRVLCAFAFFEL